MAAEKKEVFLDLFMCNQARIYSFILMLVPNYADADDLMQDTCQTLWVKFEDFKPGSDFLAWACKVARNKIMNHRTSMSRGKCVFSDPALLNIVSEAKTAISDTEQKMQALQLCLLKLSEDDRRLVALRYEQQLKVKAIAEKQGRSVNGLSHSLARIHQLLLACIKRRLNLRENGLC